MFTRPSCSFQDWPVWGYLPVLTALAAVWAQGVIFAQSTGGGELKLDTGQQIYEAACIGCHGPGGKGQPQSILGFTPPATFPDFSDCNGTVRERVLDWKATIHEGGPAGRAFSEIMPSFSEALTAEQIDMVAQYLRTLCTETVWPPGELNLPRALGTEKAFPEDEAVLTTGINTTKDGNVENEFVYEMRIGARNQLEVSFPFGFAQQGSGGSWFGGVGDLALGLKRVLYHHLSSNIGSIFSLQGEVSLPTGNKNKGLGSGILSFKTFAAFGQLLPRMSFVQVQAGAELPKDTTKAPQSVFWNTAVGKTFVQRQGLGRIWTPMVEFLSSRDLVDGAKTDWDILPQIQVSLSKRQHILANVGVRIPTNNTAARATQLVFYVLWDWFDGGLREGWR
jgi:mono/diheme cytochrome c family protein